MKGVVSCVTNEKVLKAKLLNPRVVPTREAVVATHQVKLSMLVKAAWHYDLPFPRSWKSQTHTQNTTINIIDIHVISTTKCIFNIKEESSLQQRKLDDG